MKKIYVIKAGSNVLTRPDGNPDISNMSLIVDQIAALHRQGIGVVLVSSGAVACGRTQVKPASGLDPVAQRMLFSSVGQIRLLNIYSQLFSNQGITIGQVLTQKENFASRQLYLNQRHCIMTMLSAGIVPVVNENDTVSLTELMFTDNDELAGLVASMTGATGLIILTNVDGIYTAAPSDPAAELIQRVAQGDDPSTCVVQTKSGFGRGGMQTKCATAMRLASEGVAVYIARGTRPGIIGQIVTNPLQAVCTTFEPAQQPVSPVKRWIAHSQSFAEGVITVNAGAKDALLGPNAVSLLPVGVTGFTGRWDEGDIVNVCDSQGATIAVGKAAISSQALEKNIGQPDAPAVIHYDYLFIN